jgi:hypothetical protein
MRRTHGLFVRDKQCLLRGLTQSTESSSISKLINHTQIKADDIVIIEPPAWQKIRKPAKIRKFTPPEKLEELMERHGRNKTT